jgi:hypothetical protein
MTYLYSRWSATLAVGRTVFASDGNLGQRQSSVYGIPSHVLACGPWCSAVQCSAVQCSAVQCSAVQCGVHGFKLEPQRSAASLKTVINTPAGEHVQCSAVQCSAVQCSAV